MTNSEHEYQDTVGDLLILVVAAITLAALAGLFWLA